MRRFSWTILLLVLLGCGKPPQPPTSSELAQQKPRSPPRILTYKQEDPGLGVSALLTEFGGVCNVTVTRTSDGKADKQTWSVPLDRFNAIWSGLTNIPAIASRRLGNKFDPFESTDYHLIMTVPTKATYAIPESETNEAFTAWVRKLTTKTE